MRRILLALMLSALSICGSSCRSRLTRDKAQKMIEASTPSAYARFWASMPVPPSVHFEPEFDQVTGITFDPGDRAAHANFKWHLKGQGLAFYSTADFRLYDDGWRIEEGELQKSLGSAEILGRMQNGK